MSRALLLHSTSRCDAVERIVVDVERLGARGLRLAYTVTGAIRDLRLPEVMPGERADELWRHTCFEAFVRAPASEVYAELNFAPSTNWAAYRFSGHRQGMSAVRDITPQIEVLSTEGSFTLRALLKVTAIPALTDDTAWRLGLSAVIEEASGRISYWALAHPPGKPDFHHSDCFALELGPASRA